MPTGIPATPRAKVTFSGLIDTAPWASSFWCGRADDSDPTTTLQAVVDAIKTLATTNFTADWAPFSYTDVQISTCRLDLYSASSRSSRAQASSALSGVFGTAGNPSAASQAVVLSLYTATTGKTGRGRMYLPATASTSTTSPYKFLTSQMTALAGGFADFLTAVPDAFDANGMGVVTPSVSSGGSTLSGGPGPSVHPINRVRIDGRPDRIEHREKSLAFPVVFASVP